MKLKTVDELVRFNDLLDHCRDMCTFTPRTGLISI